MIKYKSKVTREEILNTKFKTEMLGYATDEVDQMLDNVLEDYRTFEDTISELNIDCNNKAKLIIDKDEEIEKLKLELMNYKDIQKKMNKQK